MIATAATEQTAASAEISASAHDISLLASEGSRAAQVTTDACKTLSALATDLDGIIHQFRIDEPTHPVGNLRPTPTNVEARAWRTA